MRSSQQRSSLGSGSRNFGAVGVRPDLSQAGQEERGRRDAAGRIDSAATRAQQQAKDWNDCQPQEFPI